MIFVITCSPLLESANPFSPAIGPMWRRDRRIVNKSHVQESFPKLREINLNGSMGDGIKASTMLSRISTASPHRQSLTVFKMGPPVRERYNAKARQSTVGGSSHKKRRRNKASQVEAEAEPWTGFDSNAEILPEDAERKKIEVREGAGGLRRVADSSRAVDAQGVGTRRSGNVVQKAQAARCIHCT